MFKYCFHVLLSASCLSLARAQAAEKIATAFALLYGYPLLAFEKPTHTVLNSVPVNNFFHKRELATAADRSVVEPNVDTLYLTTIFELLQSDLAITIPDVPTGESLLFSFLMCKC